MSGAETGEPPTFDPRELTSAQCYGDACVCCHKKWPRPRERVGRLPDGLQVLACDDCASAMVRLATVRPVPGRPVELVAHN